MDSKPKLYLKSPYWLWLLIGGVSSCIIPVSIGLYIFFNRGHNLEPLEVALWMTFIFGTIIAAWLGCFKVNMNKENGFNGAGTFVVIGIKSATLVHFTASILAVLSMGQNSGFVGLMVVGLFSLIYQIPLWIFVTLPLSALCGWIFRLVAIQEQKQA